MKISKEKWTHYFLIYLSLQFIGGRIFTYFGSNMYGVALAIGIMVIVLHYPRYKFPECQNWIILIGISLLFSFMLTMGDLSARTCLSVISRFIVVWATVLWNKEEFSKRFIKVSAFLCGASLVTFFLMQILGYSFISKFFAYLPCVKSTKGVPVSYGLFAFVFNVMDPYRNAGIFGEPGEMQIMVNLGLYFVLYNSGDLENRSRIKYIVLFLVTMVTNLSTTGLFNTAIIVLAFVLGKYRNENKTVQKFLYVFLIAMVVYLLFFAGENSFMYSAVLNKITVNGKIDLSGSTGSARLLSFVLLSKVISSSPLSLIFGIGFRGMGRFSSEETALACSGLISGLIMYGAITNILIYGKVFSLAIKKRVDWYESIALIFMVFNNGLSQPDIMAVAPVIVAVYLMCRTINQDEESCMTRGIASNI